MAARFLTRSIFGKILAAVLGILVLAVGGLSYWNYRMMESESVGRIQDRLKAIAATGALQIDAAAHARVQDAVGDAKKAPAGADERAAFDRLVASLRRVRAAAELSTDMYTLRLAEDKAGLVRSRPQETHEGGVEFIAMTNGSPYFKDRLTYRPFMAPALLHGRAVATEIYRDAHGSWISALAPIKTGDGATIAVLETDISFDDYHRKNLAVLRDQAVAGGTILLAAGLIAFLLSRSIAGPVSALTIQARKLGEGDYGSAIHVRSKDEIGALADVLDGTRVRIQSFIHDILDIAPFIMIVFDSKFTARDTVSHVARRCFGEDTAGRHLIEFLEGRMGNQTAPSREFLDHIAAASATPEIFADMMKLACERLMIGERIFAVTFLPRFEEGRFVSLFMLGEDITEAERARAATRRAIMLMTLIRDYDEFMTVKETLDEGFERLEEIATVGEGTREDLDEAFRIAHTIKGSLGMFAMDREVAAASGIEDAIQESLSSSTASRLSVPDLSGKIRLLKRVFDEDIVDLKRVRGETGDDFLRIYNAEIEALRRAMDSSDRSAFDRILSQLDLPLLSAHVRTLSKNLSRTASRKLDKHAACEVIPESDVRLPDPWRRLLDVALPHMIRNAIDHGLEYPQEREALGKPSSGTVTVKTFQESGRFVVSVRDDGRGIDDEAILQAARERGLVPEGGRPDSQDLRRMILLSGFSTRADVTEISGRGVGLDAVAAAVKEMGGGVEILSEPGKFTEFRLAFPTA